MKIKTSPMGYMEDYTVILSRPDHTHLGQLGDITDLEISLNMTGGHEIAFTYHKPSENYLNTLSASEVEHIQMLWTELTDFKYVYVRELEEYFCISVSLNEDNAIEKRITGSDASSFELSQSILYGLEINTETDINREEYQSPTIFYAQDNPENSLLDRALSKVPQWSVEFVDNTLVHIQRTFSTDDQDIWSFLTGTVASEIGCLFTFNSVNRTICAYDLKTRCVDCGHRGEFSDVCPECGSTALMTYGKDTGILIDTENLADNIVYSVDTDSVKNTFKMVCGDDDMTAAVQNINPNGSAYIYHFSDDEKHDMPSNLVTRLDEYDAEVEKYTPRYREITEGIYEAIDKVIYFTSGMMPTVEFTPTTAQDQVESLKQINLTEMGMNQLKESTSITTINNAIKQYATLFVRTGWYRIDIVESEFTYNGLDEHGVTAGVWRGKMKISSWSTYYEKEEEDRDEATTPELTVTVTDDYEKYVDQKIKKHLKENDDSEDGSVYDVLVVEDLEEFGDYLTYYCLRRLESFADAIQGCMDIMIEADQATPGRELYDYYLSYVDKLDRIRTEIDRRQHSIDVWQEKYDTLMAERAEIQDILNFEKFLGTNLYKTFCIYKKEQTYVNDNYIVDALDDKEIFEKAEQFYKTASEELYKSSERQHHIESTLHNLLTQPEFKPLVDKFELGNYIRAKIDGKVYKLRLIKIGLDGESKADIDVEFSDVFKLANGVSDLQSVLNSAKQMASSYDAAKNQIRKNAEQSAYVRDFVRRGFDLTQTKILNNPGRQETVIDDSGIWMMSKDDFTDQYDPCQVRMIANGLYFTNDKWRSVKAAFGKYITVDPVSGEQYEAYGLLADTIVGRIILGESLGIYSQDGSSKMSFDNKGLVLNTVDNGDGVYKNIFTIQKDGENQMWIDNQGNIVLATDQMIKTTEDVEQLKAQYAQIDNQYVHNSTMEQVFAGEAGVGDLQVINLTAKNCVLADASIAEAVIAQLNAGKVDAAFINTDFIKVGDTNGNLLMKNSTLQVIDDEGNVRVQVGKDESTGEYSYWLWNADGQLIWEPTGITAAGVPDQLIVDDMVKDDAGIQGSKLDIDSVVERINDGSTVHLDITKIQIDGTTLDYKIAELITKDTELEQSTTDLGTELEIVQGQIDQKIWNTDITTALDPINGEVTTIKQQYSETTQTIDAMKESIKSVETKQSETESSMNSKFNTIENTIDSHTQKIEDLSTKVSDDYNEMSTKYNDVKDTLDSHTQTIADVQTGFQNLQQSQDELGKSVDSLDSKVSEAVQDLSGFKLTVSETQKKTEEDINDLQTALDGKADGSKVEELSQSVSSIQQTTTNINTKVTSIETTVNKTIVSVDYKYLERSNNKIVPSKTDPDWQDQPPIVAEDHYLWSMTVITYADGSVEQKQPYCVNDKAEDVTLLRIDSDNGYSFRNNKGNTTLSITIMKGRKTMTTLAEVKAEYGDSAKILWKEKPTGQTAFIDIPSADSRIINDGMGLKVTADTVLTRTIFNAYLDA